MILLQDLPRPQSPPFFKREFANDCENQLVEHGNERETGAYGKEKKLEKRILPVFPRAPATERYGFERANGNEAVTRLLGGRYGEIWAVVILILLLTPMFVENDSI